MDDNGRYIALDALFDNNPVILVNYYAPNVETDQMRGPRRDNSYFRQN